MSVLYGRAAPSPAPTPYRPVAEAFLSGLRGRDLDGDRGLMRFRHALGVLAPGLFDVEVDAAPSMVLLGEATLALINRCSTDSGALLVLEDLHWAGGETCELVDYLSDKLDRMPIAMLVSVRTGEGSDAERVIRLIESRRNSAVLHLRRLDEADIDAVIRASLGMGAVPPGLRREVTLASRGVPLLVEDVLATLVDTGALQRKGTEWNATEDLRSLMPSSFAALVHERFDTFDPISRSVLEAAAILGEQFSWELVAELVHLDHEIVLRALRRACDAQLVEESAALGQERFRFRHGLSRIAVLESVVEPERARLASAALSMLEANSETADGAQLELLADLAVTSGVQQRATDLLVRASCAATQQGACASARRFAMQAIESATSIEGKLAGREALLDACVASGDTKATAEVGQDVLAELGRLGAAADRRARVGLRLAAAAVDATDWSRASAQLDAVVAEASDLDAADLARIDLLRAHIALGQHDPQLATHHAERALAEASDLSDSALTVETLTALGRAYRVIDLETARATFARAVTVAQTAGSELLLARAEHELATIDVLEAGPTDRLERARRLAVKVGAVGLAAVVDHHLTILHWLRFELDEAEAAGERAVAAATHYELGLKVPAASVIRPDAVLGRRAETIAQFELVLPLMDDEIEATARGHMLAISALSCEQRSEALEELERAAALAPVYSDVARSPHAGLRALLLAVEDDPRAQDVTSALDADRAVVGVARHLTELALAVSAGRGGDPVSAHPRIESALRQLRRTPWFLAMAQRLTAEAALSDGWGTPHVLLESAMGFFDANGITAPAAACRAMLDQAGVGYTPSDPGDSGDAGEHGAHRVTKREADVMALVAQGLSNRQIAAKLYLSIRTVEKHVERLLAKTGAVNRTQLAALAHRADQRHRATDT